MSALILDSVQHWSCPNCPVTDRTVGQANRFHQCRGLAGVTAPLVLAGVRCQVRAVEREDYIGKEDVQLDGNGRPIMAVVTERSDGSNDLIAFAATAYLRGEA
jgi:hypothetical protein